MNTISIIIPTMGKNLGYLKFCIDSIKKYSKNQHEIIVISNPDPHYEIPIEGIKRLHSEKQGQCISVNTGVKEASNEYVLISDDDVIFPPNWEELVDKAREVDFLSGNFMESGKKGGVASPFITNDCGNSPEEFNWEKFENDSSLLKEDKFENGFGFPLICKKEFWEKIGGYDELYDPWGSNCDSDLEYKVMLAGVVPKRWRGVLTYHFAQVSRIFDHSDYWQKNKNYFEKKWGMRRADTPMIWYCDFVINGDSLRYKPEWAELENNPNVYFKKFGIKHTGWVSNNLDLFERFWCGIMGFKRVWESIPDKDMFKVLFDIDASGIIRRYEKDGITIEVHCFAPPVAEDSISFDRRGINHFCLLVDDRDRLLKTYPFEKKVYDNPKGHQNVFIRDLEGNWIEIYKDLGI